MGRMFAVGASAIVLVLLMGAVAISPAPAASSGSGASSLGTRVQLRDFLTSQPGRWALANAGLKRSEREAAFAAARKGNFRRCVQEQPAWCAVVYRNRISFLGIPELVGEVRINPDFSQDATFVRNDVVREAVRTLVATKVPGTKTFKLVLEVAQSQRAEDTMFHQHVLPCFGACADSACHASINFPRCLKPIVVPAPTSVAPGDSPSSASAASAPGGEPGSPSCAAGGTSCPPVTPPSGPVTLFPPCQPGNTACVR